MTKEFVDSLINDPIKLKKFLRDVMGPERRPIFASEREHLLTVFKLIEPVHESNNQRSITEVYEHAGKTYHVHYYDNDIEVDEIIPDDIQQD